MIKQALLAFVLSLIFIVPVFADTDSGLYNPKISAEDHFVRFINNTDAALSPSLNAQKYRELRPHQTSPYFLIKSDEIKFSDENYDFTGEIEQGGFYTLVIGAPMKLLPDQRVTDRTKAVIAFYNLSPLENISLKAKEGKVTVFENLEPITMQARDINATKIDMSIFNGAEKITALPDIILERGQHYSVIFDGTSAHIVPAEIDFNQ